MSWLERRRLASTGRRGLAAGSLVAGLVGTAGGSVSRSAMTTVTICDEVTYYSLRCLRSDDLFDLQIFGQPFLPPSYILFHPKGRATGQRPRAFSENQLERRDVYARLLRRDWLGEFVNALGLARRAHDL
ncbi:hypothetical protein EVAR_27329_1 [Eumeta japonica]|uniref:Uncharacterized protein n=1 Tax=Eumeta variegata TaxID=151549 RepID=A0A4C1UCD6_EUMVA|nr:hypothetical protein EVAR_27329_1 [Eumeta japonica]